MRWKWILPRFIIVALLLSFLQFGVDPLLRFAGIRAMQAITGARVDVDSVATTYFPPSATVQGVAVASARRPGKNLFQFDTLSFRLESQSLSQRRFVVEDARMEGLQFDTDRSDNGQLPFQPKIEESEPSWLTEKLTAVSQDWLQEVQDDAFAKLDPHQLQTWRVGNSLYEEWDQRFRILTSDAKSLEPRVRQLRDQFRSIPDLPPLQQIEMGVRLAEESEKLLADVQLVNQELRQIAPKLQVDVNALNTARLNDQEMIRNRIAAFHPDGRFLSQMLLGKDLYLQINQLLTWVETFTEYQSGLEEQIHPERQDGRWLPLLATEQGPDFHLRNLAFTGVMSIHREAIPWTGTLQDVSSNPELTDRPAVLRATATGTNDVQLTITADRRQATRLTTVAASWLNHDGFSISAGRPEQMHLRVALKEPRWQLNLQLADTGMRGFISLDTTVDNVSIDSEGSIRPELLQATTTALNAVHRFQAAAAISGSLRHPRVELSSDLGDQLATGLRTAFTEQFEAARTSLLAEVDRRATSALDQLKNRCEGEYTRLAAENRKLLDQIQEARTLAISLKSAKSDPGQLLKHVSQSKLLSEGNRTAVQKVEKAFSDAQSKTSSEATKLLLGAPLAPPSQIPGNPDPLAIPGLLPGNLPALLQKTVTKPAGTSPSSPGMLPEIIPGLRWNR